MTNAHEDGNIYARSKANLAAMMLRYPKQFDCDHMDRNWPDGWNHLVARVCEAADQSGLEFRWIQIKEKWGGLRMYWNEQPFRIDFVSNEGRRSAHHGEVDPVFEPMKALIAVVETESLETCCKCGAIGHEVDLGGWLLTVCDDCKPRIDAYREEAIRRDTRGL